MHGAASVLGLAAHELHVALFSCRCDRLLSLFKGRRTSQPVTVGCTHVIHADRRDRLHVRVNLGGADDEAAANPQNANPISVNEELGTQKIDRSTEIFGINIRRNNAERLPFTLAPEG